MYQCSYWVCSIFGQWESKKHAMYGWNVLIKPYTGQKCADESFTTITNQNTSRPHLMFCLTFFWRLFCIQHFCSIKALWISLAHYLPPCSDVLRHLPEHWCLNLWHQPSVYERLQQRVSITSAQPKGSQITLPPPDTERHSFKEKHHMTRSQCLCLDSTLSVFALSHVFLEHNRSIVHGAMSFWWYIKQACCFWCLEGTRLDGESKKTQPQIMRHDKTDCVTLTA